MRSAIEILERFYRKLIVKFFGVERKAPKRRISLPLIPSRRPATLYLDNAKIFEIIPFP